MSISDPAQTPAKLALERVLGKEFQLRAEVLKLQRTHARDDPVDKISDLDKMPSDEAEALISRRIGAFRCTQCSAIFCEGIVCAAAADAEPPPADAKKTCQTCTIKNNVKPGGTLVAIDFSKCPEPLYKCDLCCSVAKYRCPDYYQCEKHHSQGSKTVELCPGKDKCPLACAHPQNARVKRGFIIGCNCDKCGK